MIREEDWEARHPHLARGVELLCQGIAAALMFAFICLVVLALTGGW